MPDSSSVAPRTVSAPYLQRLAETLQAQGWQLRPQGRQRADNSCDLVVEHDERCYAVAIQVAREGRRILLESLWANAYLRARVQATRHGGQPLAVVAAPHLTDRLVREIVGYIQTFAPEAAYGLMDAQGRLVLAGPGLEPPTFGTPMPLAESPARVKPVDLFSDLHQWLLKVLLAQRLPPQLLTAPRAPLRTATDLARLAKVSLPTASRLLSQLQDQGYLERDRRGMQLVRVGDLLRRWQAASLRPSAETPARFLLPVAEPGTRLRALARELAAAPPRPEDGHGKPRTCLGLFGAADALALAHTRGAQHHLYLEDHADARLEELGLLRVESNAPADLVLRRPNWPESIFRGAVRIEGVPAADVLQTWLDVSAHPARGREQAELIWDRVLRPMLLEDR